jgi:hypothetical protein
MKHPREVATGKLAPQEALLPCEELAQLCNRTARTYPQFELWGYAGKSFAWHQDQVNRIATS